MRFATALTCLPNFGPMILKFAVRGLANDRRRLVDELDGLDVDFFEDDVIHLFDQPARFRRSRDRDSRERLPGLQIRLRAHRANQTDDALRDIHAAFEFRVDQFFLAVDHRRDVNRFERFATSLRHQSPIDFVRQERRDAARSFS